MVTAQQERIQVFFIGGAGRGRGRGVPNFGLERTVELFCGKSLEFSLVAKCNTFH